MPLADVSGIFDPWKQEEGKKTSGLGKKTGLEMEVEFVEEGIDLRR